MNTTLAQPTKLLELKSVRLTRNAIKKLMQEKTAFIITPTANLYAIKNKTTKFTLAECYEALSQEDVSVDTIQMVYPRGWDTMPFHVVADEEGLCKANCMNLLASQICSQPIVGTILVIPSHLMFN